MTPILERDGEVFLLRLDDDENRFHPDWLTAFDAALDVVEAEPTPVALVTAGAGKFFSNGLDLDWLAAHRDETEPYLARVQALFARLLASRVYSVAAVTGHAFAGGGMLALAHDERVMRQDRGFWCLPEVDLGMMFRPGMIALVRDRLAPQVAHEALTTGRRYGGLDATAAGIVEHTAPEDDVVAVAVERARVHASSSVPVRAEIKAGLYTGTLAALRG